MRIRPAEPDELALVGELTLAAYVADGFTDVDDHYADELRAADQRAAAGPAGRRGGTPTATCWAR